MTSLTLPVPYDQYIHVSIPYPCVRVFVTSDIHFKFDSQSDYARNDLIIDGWNSIVNEQDYVIIAGDVVANGDNMTNPCEIFKHRIPPLHGHKRLVIGNHDVFQSDSFLYEWHNTAGFEIVYGVPIILNNQFVITHALVQDDGVSRCLPKGSVAKWGDLPYFYIYGHEHHDRNDETGELVKLLHPCNSACVCMWQQKQHFADIVDATSCGPVYRASIPWFSKIAAIG